MAFIPSQTSGLGVAAKIGVAGNQGTSQVPGKNNVILSVSGATYNSVTYASTFQLNPQIQDVSGASITPGTAFTLSAAANASGGTTTYTGTITGAGTALTLSAVAASSSTAGTAVYTGTITGGGSNGLVGDIFAVTGFTNAANNGVFVCVASTTTTLTLTNIAAVAETHAGTATTTFAGLTFVVAGFTNAANNGTFLATSSTSTTLVLANTAGVSETHAGTATSEEIVGGNVITYVAYPAKTLTGNTYQPSGTSTVVAKVSTTGLITAVAPGGVEVEVSYPAFNNGSGTTGAEPDSNPMFGLPLGKIYGTVNVTVYP